MEKKTNKIFQKSWVEENAKMTRWESFCLWFVKKETFIDTKEGITLTYKTFRDKTYLIKHEIHPIITNDRLSIDAN